MSAAPFGVMFVACVTEEKPPFNRSPYEPFRRHMSTEEYNVKTSILLAVLALTLTGCATVNGAHAVATPWGVGGLYSFRDKPALAGEPHERATDVQVAKALDAFEQQQDGDADVRVVAR
jgi:predicted cobalt transporter CbtA